MLNLEGWVTPEQDFAGLYKIGDDLRRNKQLAEQKANRLHQEQEDKDAKRLATAKFIESTYDPKDLFTGTLEDPNITSGIMDLKRQAYELSAQGVDPTMISFALSGKAAKLSDYSEKAKAVGRQWKETEPFLKTQKGIDVAKAKSEYEKMAFMDENGRVKDPSLIDHEKNYIDEVLKTKDVYNNEGIQDFVANTGKDTRINKVKRTNSKGGSYMTDAELSYPSFMIPEQDEKGNTIGFEPEFEYATSENEKVVHDFGGKQGHVKMVTDDVFRSLKPNAMAYILQEARKGAALHGKHPSETEVENYAKAIAYDELKNAAKTSSSIKDIVATKANPAPRISVTVKNAADVPVIDVYKTIREKIDNHIPMNKAETPLRSKVDGKIIMGGIPATALDDTELDVVMGKVKKYLGNDATLDDFYLRKYGDGSIAVVNTANDKAITTLTKIGANVTANQSLGVKSKDKAVKNAQSAGADKWKKYAE